MARRFCFLALLLAVILIGAGCGGGGTPPAPGSVDGYVYATNGGVRSLAVRGLLEDAEAATLKPIAGATVIVVGVGSTTTDVNGFFRIDNIDPGTYSVTIQSTGYDTLTINSVGITSGNVTHLNERNITMAQKAWNFLVYLDGDNDLEPFAIGDLNEMEQVGSNANVNILVLIDRIPGYDTTNGNWTGTRLYYVTQDNTSTISSTLLVDFGERDMSDPNTLMDFVIYCQEHFPAQKTCLTLWNHGNGVWPRAIAQGTAKKQTKGGNAGGKDGTGILARGICWDDTTGTSEWDCLTTDEVADALAAARAATGQKIDVINMDACLTQMLEVAYEWKNEAYYLVGSEETVPGDGNAYNTVLAHLTGNPAMSASSLATTLVDDYYAYYGLYDTTYSAINLGSSFNTLISAFSTFATALKNTTHQAEVYEAWIPTTYFTSFEQNDLYDFANETIAYVTDAAVTSAAASLKTAITNAVLHHHETGGYVGIAFGIGIMISTADEWPFYSGSNQYVMLDLSTNTNWDEFLINFAGLRVNGYWPTYTGEWRGFTGNITFYSDHTCLSSFGSSGAWSLNGDNVQWRYDDYPNATYVGTVNAGGTYMSGTMSNLDGQSGDWNASR